MTLEINEIVAIISAVITCDIQSRRTPYGNINSVNTGISDLVKDVTGDTITLDGNASLVVNSLAGDIVEATGGDNDGTQYVVLSNTSADPTVITLTSTPPADLDEDPIRIIKPALVLVDDLLEDARSNGIYKWQSFLVHVKGTSELNLETAVDGILGLDTLCFHTNSYSGSTPVSLRVEIGRKVDITERFIKIEGKWLNA